MSAADDIRALGGALRLPRIEAFRPDTFNWQQCACAVEVVQRPDGFVAVVRHDVPECDVSYASDYELLPFPLPPYVPRPVDAATGEPLPGHPNYVANSTTAVDVPSDGHGSATAVPRQSEGSAMAPRRQSDGSSMALDVAALEANARELLVLLGEDPERPGLRDTPRRVAKAWVEFMEYDPGTLTTAFEHTSEQLVLVAGVRVWTLCEHHLHPFYVDLAMAYISQQRVLGLSKLARIAHHRAHGLNLQEGLVRDIADDIATATGSEHVAVLGVGEHLCMTMRGIRTPGKMLSTELRGAFRGNAAARAEFYDLCKLAGMEAGRRG